MADDKKRLNIKLPFDVYELMQDKVNKSDIKNITELIKSSINEKLKKEAEEAEKDILIKSELLDDLFEIMKILYKVKNFNDPYVKIIIYNNYKTIKDNIKNKKDLWISSLNISMKELIMLELSCYELDLLIENKIIKRDVK